ncbi:hypothetical protein L1887_31438 [Cichorium endivia]|nr:hypothetical protein L1887_31438 [Cichorium endivia]
MVVGGGGNWSFCFDFTLRISLKPQFLLNNREFKEKLLIFLHPHTYLTRKRENEETVRHRETDLRFDLHSIGLSPGISSAFTRTFRATRKERKCTIGVLKMGGTH